ncbi:MAG: hypothetical protein ACOZF0_15585 [Thermodesulfobacteriota bacterium]
MTNQDLCSTRRLLLHCLAAACSIGMISLSPAPAADRFADGVLAATYHIENRAVKLSNGRAEQAGVPGSAAKIITEVYGAPVSGDLNGDGLDDAALFLVQTSGGSGTFYYVAAAIADNGRVQGTPAVFLGDRVAPKTLSIRNGVVIVSYTDRGPGQSMAVSPAIGRTRYLTLEEGRLKAVKSLERHPTRQPGQ